MKYECSNDQGKYKEVIDTNCAVDAAKEYARLSDERMGYPEYAATGGFVLTQEVGTDLIVRFKIHSAFIYNAVETTC